MKVLKPQNRQLLLWHRSYHVHPIFNPDYARENLTSLIELLIKTFLYFVASIYALHLAVLYGFLETETLSWMIIENTARKYMFWASDITFLSKAHTITAISVTLLIILISGYLFRIYKANLHPGSKKMFSDYLKKQLLIKDVNGREAMRLLKKYIRKDKIYSHSPKEVNGKREKSLRRLHYLKPAE